MYKSLLRVPGTRESEGGTYAVHVFAQYKLREFQQHPQALLTALGLSSLADAAQVKAAAERVFADDSVALELLRRPGGALEVLDEHGIDYSFC